MNDPYDRPFSLGKAAERPKHRIRPDGQSLKRVLPAFTLLPLIGTLDTDIGTDHSAFSTSSGFTSRTCHVRTKFSGPQLRHAHFPTMTRLCHSSVTLSSVYSK
jgi:hypothetical protein